MNMKNKIKKIINTRSKSINAKEDVINNKGEGFCAPRLM